MITERDLAVLCAVARYFVLNRPQIQSLCFPEDSDGRITRRRLIKLVKHGVLQKQPVQICDLDGGTPSAVYYPARRGLEIIAEHFSDKSFLRVSTQAPQPHCVRHWLAISETHMIFDQAIAAQSTVQMVGWLNEWDTISTEATEPENRFCLYSLLEDSPRLVNAPDASFLLGLGSHRKVYYLEQDMNTTGVDRIAAAKTKGFAELAKREWHRRHWPETTVATFTVLMIAPNARRRDHLRRAINGKPGCELWRFIAKDEFTPQSALSSLILYRCDSDEPVPLVKPVTQQIVPGDNQ